MSHNFLTEKPISIMSDNKPIDADQFWREWFTTSAFGVEKRLLKLFRALPHDPRCKFCYAPFEGFGGTILRAVPGRRQSNLNPRFCNTCEDLVYKFPGRAEVEMSMLFTDGRGSAALSEHMSPMEFSRLINRFDVETTNAII